MQHETSKGHDFGVTFPLDSKDIEISDKGVTGLKNLFNYNPSTKRRSRFAAGNQMDLHVRSWRNCQSERLA